MPPSYQTLILQETMRAINDPNGIVQDIWLRIIALLGEKDPSVMGVCCYGARYYVTEAQRKRLQQMVPYMSGGSLALPPHIEPDPLRCNKCKGPFHPATGHAFDEIIVACGPCYGRFAAWQLQKYGWKPLSNQQIKKINKSRNKAARKAEKIAKALVRQQAQEIIEHEQTYGKPREAQSMPVILG
jgi:hypothetical protein